MIEVKGRLNGCRYVGRKEETRMKSNGRVKRKTPRYGRRREKAMDTKMGASPGYQSQPNTLETHVVRGHWTPTSAEPIQEAVAVIQPLLRFCISNFCILTVITIINFNNVQLA